MFPMGSSINVMKKINRIDKRENRKYIHKHKKILQQDGFNEKFRGEILYRMMESPDLWSYRSYEL